MKLEIVDNHSYAPELLTKGPVLDAGCRGWRFSEHFAKLGHPVVCMDPDIVTPPITLYDTPNWCHYFRSALVGEGHPKRAHLRMTADPEARHVTIAGAAEGDPSIECMTLAELMRELQLEHWDLIKLNVEGAEYDILSTLAAPVARQIVVSFHEHTGQRRGEAAIATIVEHLGNWYVPLRHEFDERYGAGRNAWDSVFVLRELA